MLSRKFKLRAAALMSALILSILPAAPAFAGAAEAGTEAETMQEETLATDESEALENYDAASQNLQNAYYSALDELTEEDGPMAEGTSFSKWLYIRFFRTYRALKTAAPYICAMSVFAGIVLCAVGHKSRMFVRSVVAIFIILIPFGTLFIIFGLGTSFLFK